MPETQHHEHKIELTLNLNVNIQNSDSRPGAADILHAIREQGLELMTALSDGVAALTADDQALSDEVDTLIAAFQALPGDNSAALQAALDAANVDAASATSIIAASDAVVQAAKAKIVAALSPATPPEDGGETTVEGGQA